MQTRRTRLQLIYEGTDISQDIATDFISFDYTDNEHGKADDISIDLKDNKGLWTGAWFPGKGDSITATIIDEGHSALYCGKFNIDELSASGPPQKFTIKGVSIPLSKSIRRKAKNKAWESVVLSTIVREIAVTGGLQLIFDVETDPTYERIDQREESDLAFLQRLCESEGFNLKITDSQIVVFDQAKYESSPIYRTIVQGVDDIISWSFESQAYDLYKECLVTYYDPKTETNIESTFLAPGITSGMSAKITKRAATYAEAERIAKAELRRRNKNEVKGSLTLPGDTGIISGVNLQLIGWGAYQGKYIIEKAAHSVTNGYTTKMDLRRVLEGF